MAPRQLTILTLTYNVAGHIAAYWDSVARLDRAAFDWIILDGGSTDGTAEFLGERRGELDYYASEADGGFYPALNKALQHVRTPYYLVFGADDRPAPDLIASILPHLDGAALVLGGVRLMPSGQVKWPGPRWIHPLVWGRAVSHHSVGTAIRTDVHQTFGRYDTRYALVADGALLKRILSSDEPVRRVPAVFGEFALGGMSSRGALRSIVESFLLQVEAGSNACLQLVMLNLRLTKFFAVRMLRSRSVGEAR